MMKEERVIRVLKEKWKIKDKRYKVIVSIV
jgi:hypothetical protein